MSLPITFLSDYGYADGFAGVCRVVIARIAPQSRITDITHGIPRHGIRQGATVLASAVPHAETGVHLAVVDPGVGSERRPVAIRAAGGSVLVGPDNGLLGPAAEALGGAVAAVDLSRSRFRIEPVAATFHGRDVFAPVAARIAAGAALDEAGEAIETAGLRTIEVPAPRIYPERVIAHVLYEDVFGNLALNLGGETLGPTFLRIGDRALIEGRRGRATAPFAQTFSDVGEGECLLYEDSAGSLAIAVNRGSAAELLGLSTDDEVTLSPAS